MESQGGPSGAKALVSAVTPPLFTEATLADEKLRAQFLHNYDSYREQCRVASAVTGAVGKVTIKSLIGRTYVEMLIQCRSISSPSFERTSDKDLRQWLCPRVTSAETSVQDIEKAVESITWKYQNKFKVSVETMAVLFLCRLKDHGYESMVIVPVGGDEDEPKPAAQMVIRLFYKRLANTALHTPVSDQFTLNARNANGDVQKDWAAFYEMVVEKAEALDKGGVANCAPVPQSMPRRGEGKLPYQRGGRQQEQRQRFNDRSTQRQRPVKPETPEVGEQHKLYGEEARSSTFRPACPARECRKDNLRHYIRDCPNVTRESDRKRLLEGIARRRHERAVRRFERKKSTINRVQQNVSPTPLGGLATAVVPVDRADGSLAPMVAKVNEKTAGKEVSLDLVVSIGGEEIIDCRADTGADVSIMPTQVADRLVDAGVPLVFIELDTPEEFQTCVPDKVFYARKRVVVPELACKTLGDGGQNIPPIIFKRVPFFLADVGEVLLGNDFLVQIGFDFSKYLRENAWWLEGSDEVYDGLSEDTGGTTIRSFVGSEAEPDFSLEADFGEPPLLEIGTDTVEEKAAAMDDLRERALENLPESHHLEFDELLREYGDVFSTKLGSDPPARIAAMPIRMPPEAKPYRTKPRKYTPQQVVFLRQYLDTCEKHGLLKKVATSNWVSPIHLVRKDPPAMWRVTFDLRAPNAQEMKDRTPLPNIEEELQRLQGAKIFAKMDFSQGYWQIPLAEADAEAWTFRGIDALYQSTRVLQGGKNSASFLLLQSFFAICREKGLKVKPGKVDLFVPEVTYCGRIISQNGVKFEPRNLGSILQISAPRDLAQLQQWLCATAWMRLSIPAYAELAAPLQALVQAAKRDGLTSKGKLRNVKLTAPRWGVSEQHAFDILKEACVTRVTMSHRDPRKILCLSTDASDTHYAAVLSQCDPAELDKAYAEQTHEALGFLSSGFKGAALRWSTLEKEAYVIVEAMQRFSYLTIAAETRIFTDHRNICFLFNPMAASPTLANYVVDKVARWALRLSTFEYSVVHIPGEDNHFADLMSRWGQKGYAVSERRTVRRLVQVPAPSAIGKGDEAEAIRKEVLGVQCHLSTADRRSLTKTSRGWQTHEGALAVPSHAATDAVKVRILVLAHAGLAGHRGVDVTMANVRAGYTWQGLADDVRCFVRECLFCRQADGQLRIQRPYTQTTHATKPSQLVHFDYLYIGDYHLHVKYLLLLKDDAANFVWLRATRTCDGETTLEQLLEWCATFGVPKLWASDRGSHFVNQLLQALATRLGCTHHLTASYAPHSNGTIEIACRATLKALRALVAEYKLAHREWPSVVPLVQTVLNFSASPRLGGVAPVTAMTGLPATNPLLVPSPVIVTDAPELSLVELERICAVDELRAALENIHKTAAKQSDKARQNAIAQHNLRTNVYPVDFAIGTFVLLALPQPQKVRKLATRWHGPLRVVRMVNERVYEVEDLITHKRSEAHANRLCFYADNVALSQDLRTHLEYQDSLFLVDEFLDVRTSRRRGLQLLTRWVGFPAEEATWEPASIMAVDVPVLYSEYVAAWVLTHPEERALVQALRALL